MIQRWELLQAQQSDGDAGAEQNLNSDLCDVTSWLGSVLPELDRLQQIELSTSIRDIEANIKRLKVRAAAAAALKGSTCYWGQTFSLLQEMQKTFNGYKSLMISVNLSGRHSPELQEALASANQGWTQACGRLHVWERRLQAALLQCQVRLGTGGVRLRLLWFHGSVSVLRSFTRRCTRCCCGWRRPRPDCAAPGSRAAARRRSTDAR